MSLSLQNLQAFMALLDTIDAAFDFVPSPPPPSPIARVRGSLRNAKASLKAIEMRLGTEGKEPNDKDVGDLMRLRKSLIEMTEDKWILDGLATVDLPWEGAERAAAVGVTIPAVPLRFEGAMAMIAEGMQTLAGKP